MSRSSRSCLPHESRNPTLNACAPVTKDSEPVDSQMNGASIAAKMNVGPAACPAPRYSSPGMLPPCSVTAMSSRQMLLGSSGHCELYSDSPCVARRASSSSRDVSGDDQLADARLPLVSLN